MIPRVKLEDQVTRALFFRVVAQYQSQGRDILLDHPSGDPLAVDGGFPPAIDTRGLRVERLASYKPTPFTLAFFGYGSSCLTDPPLGFSGLTRVNDGFFLKIAYQFRR